MKSTGTLFRLPFSQGEPTMHFPGCAHVEALWWSLRRNGAPPARRDITAARLGDALPHAFILDGQSAGGLRFRLIGSVLADAAGIDLTAMPFSALFVDSWFGASKAVCRTALTENATLQLRVCSQTGAFGQIVLLPLSDPRRRLLLGCLEMSVPSALLFNALTIESCRFTRDPEGHQPPAVLVAPRAASLAEQTGVPGLSEAPARFTPARKRPDAQRPALKIVVSND